MDIYKDISMKISLHEKTDSNSDTSGPASGPATFVKGLLEKAQNLLKKPLRSMPEYDPEIDGSLVSFEVPEGFEEIERYWVDEPFAFVVVLKDRRMSYYRMIEPSLTKYEKELLDRIYEDLQDILILNNTNSKLEKEIFLVDRSLFLFERYRAEISVSSIHRIIYYLKRNLLGYEKVNPLLHDPYLEDISCDGVEIPIFVYHSTYRTITSNISFEEEELDSLVVKMCQLNNKHISVSQPIVDATMTDGSRLQAILGREITPRGSSFTIRKFRKDPITAIDLINFNTCDLEMLAYFWIVIEGGSNLLFAGGTASGKTSILNATSLFMPSLAKIISIEDTRELMLHHSNWISGIARKGFSADETGEVSMYDLLKAALRQRPDYIIVGEVRGEEALTLFQAMSTGHATSSTMHAGDVQTVINRLTHDPINVPQVMLQSLNVLSIQEQVYIADKRVRRTRTIVEVMNVDPETGDLGINELFSWDPQEDRFVQVGDSYILKEIMYVRNWDSWKLQQELNNRKKILAYLAEKNMRNYVEVSLTVQVYQDSPDLVLEKIEDDTLQDMISTMT